MPERVVTRTNPGEHYFGWRFESGNGLSVRLVEYNGQAQMCQVDIHHDEPEPNDWSYKGCSITRSGNCSCGGSFRDIEYVYRSTWNLGVSFEEWERLVLAIAKKEIRP